MYRIAKSSGRVALLLVVGMVASCFTTGRTVQLVPVSDSAVRVGYLTARLETTVVATPLGAADVTSVEITMPDGELLKGDWMPGAGGGAGYGSIYESAYGPGGSGGKSIVHKGTASLIGDRSTQMRCEFYSKTFSGHVAGACQTSRGDLYRFSE